MENQKSKITALVAFIKLDYKGIQKATVYNWGMRSPIEASAICNTIFSNKTSPPKYEDWNSVLKYQAKVMEDQNQYKSPRPNSALGQYTQNLIIQKPPVPQGPLFQKPDI